MSSTDGYCRPCRYYGVSSESCDYYLITKQMRGCPAGEGCTKRVRGPKIQVNFTVSDRTRDNSPEPDYEKLAAYVSSKLSRKGIKNNYGNAKGIEPYYDAQHDILRDWRAEMRLSQKQAAEIAKVTEVVWRYWENGHTKADWPLLKKMGVRR